MWREEAGIVEMLFTYLGDYEDFSGWSSWRSIVVDILSCHEDARRRRLYDGQIKQSSVETKEDVKGLVSVPLFKNMNSMGAAASQQPQSGSEKDEFQIKKEHQPQGSVNQSRCQEHEFQIKVEMEDPDTEEDELQGMLAEAASTVSQTQHVDSMSSPYGLLPMAPHKSPRPQKKEERAYKCRYCLKGFFYSAHRNRHERIHTGDKPHSCAACGKAFSQRCDLVRHEKIHQNAKMNWYKCSFCPMQFHYMSRKNRHEMEHYADGFTVKDSNFSASAMNDATFTSGAMNDATYTSSAINDATFPASAMNDTTFTSSAMNDATFPASAMNDATFTSSAMNDATFPASAMNDATLAASAMSDASSVFEPRDGQPR